MKKIFLPISLLLITLVSTKSFSQNCLSFDGTSDKVTCGNGSSIQITGTALTLEAWIYPTSWKTNIWQGNIINKEGNFQGYMLRAGGSGQLNFNFGSGSSWNELNSSANALTLNTWQHVAGTYDGSYMRLYVNGVVIDSIATTTSIVNTTYALVIGEGSIYTTRNFPGKIDEVRIWNVARTKAEIVSQMNAELCAIPSSVKAYYTFNQGIAGGSNSSITSLSDISGNSNTGTLTNFSLSGSSSNWITGQSLTSGIVNTTLAQITTCGSYTMPNGSVVTASGNYYDTLTSSNGCDSLVTYPINFTSAHISNNYTDTSCLSYSMPNGRMITTSGIYYDTISATGSCDTLDKYVITISAGVNDSVYQTGNKLTSADTWAPSHQWVNCNTGYSPISGATNKAYTPTSTGNYAVIVKRGACVDTSDCFSITINNVGINENNLNNNFEIFPNPVTNILFINYLNKIQVSSIQLIDITGKIKTTITSDFNQMDVSEFPTGIYILRIETKNGVSSKKFIKE